MIYYTEIEFAQELEIAVWLVKKLRTKGDFPEPDGAIERCGPDTPLWSKSVVDKFRGEYQKKPSSKIDKEEFKKMALTMDRNKIARKLGIKITKVDSFARWHQIKMFGSKPNFRKPENEHPFEKWLKTHVECLTLTKYTGV